MARRLRGKGKEAMEGKRSETRLAVGCSDDPNTGPDKMDLC